MSLWGKLGVLRDWDVGAAGVDGLRERLKEALWGARDERELNIVPVGADGVIDDGPALEGGGLRRAGGWSGGQEDAVGGLPDGDLGDVGDTEVAGAGSVVLKGEVAESLTAVGGDELKITGEVGVEGGIEESYLGGEGELEGADGARVGDDGEEAALGCGESSLGPGRVRISMLRMRPVKDEPEPVTSTWAPRSAA